MPSLFVGAARAAKLLELVGGLQPRCSRSCGSGRSRDAFDLLQEKRRKPRRAPTSNPLPPQTPSCPFAKKVPLIARSMTDRHTSIHASAADCIDRFDQSKPGNPSSQRKKIAAFFIGAGGAATGGGVAVRLSDTDKVLRRAVGSATSMSPSACTAIEEPIAIRAILVHFEKHDAREQAYYRPAARAPPAEAA